MGVDAFRDAGNMGTADTSSRWTEGVWQGFPESKIREGHTDGFVREWDFCRLKPSTDVAAAEAYWDMGLRVFGSTGFAMAVANGVGLANGMTIGADGDNEGGAIRDQLCQVRLSRADKMFAWEVCLQRSAIDDTKNGLLVGLIEDSAHTATSPIAAAGTLADLNFVGFHALEADGDKFDLVYKANGVTQVSQKTDAVAIAAATDLRLGMTYRPHPDFQNSQSYVFRWWVNGQPIADTGTTAGSLGYKQIPSSAGDDFPNDVALGFHIALLNATGSTPGTWLVRRAKYGQVF
jgi:hypothetical protein